MHLLSSCSCVSVALRPPLSSGPIEHIDDSFSQWNHPNIQNALSQVPQWVWLIWFVIPFLKITMAADCYNVSIVISFSSSSQSLCWLSFLLPSITCSYISAAIFFSSLFRKLFILLPPVCYSPCLKKNYPTKLFMLSFFDLLGKNGLCFAWLVSGGIVTMDTNDNSKGLFYNLLWMIFCYAFLFVTLIS